MALATTCPQCKTSFRVVPDQLKLRRGLVRCGVCRNVFSGIDSLRYVEEIQRLASPEPIEPEPIEPEPVEPEPIEPEPIEPEPIEPEPVEPEPVEPEPVEPEPVEPEPVEPEPVEPEPVEPEPVEPEPVEPEPVEPEPVEPEPVEPEPVEPEPVEPPGQGRAAAWTAQDRFATTDARAMPATLPASEDADEEDAVDFFAPNRRARGFASRGAAFASVVAVALSALLVLQLTIGARDWLASRVPLLAPVLSTFLSPLGLRVQPPREPGALTIESFELQPSRDPSLFALSALLRNRTGHVVQWPALELSLLDGAGEVVVRKVLVPADYLADAPEALREGVRGRAEVPLHAAIEVRETAPIGYRVRIVGP